MVVKQKSNREIEKEKARGKKRYLERKVQELEAEEEIKEFDRNEGIPDDSGIGRFDGIRPDRM